MKAWDRDRKWDIQIGDLIHIFVLKPKKMSKLSSLPESETHHSEVQLLVVFFGHILMTKCESLWWIFHMGVSTAGKKSRHMGWLRNSRAFRSYISGKKKKNKHTLQTTTAITGVMKQMRACVCVCENLSAVLWASAAYGMSGFPQQHLNATYFIQDRTETVENVQWLHIQICNI